MLGGNATEDGKQQLWQKWREMIRMFFKQGDQKHWQMVDKQDRRN